MATMKPGEENARGLALSKAVGLYQGYGEHEADKIIGDAEKFLAFLYPGASQDKGDET